MAETRKHPNGMTVAETLHFRRILVALGSQRRETFLCEKFRSRAKRCWKFTSWYLFRGWIKLVIVTVSSGVSKRYRCTPRNSNAFRWKKRLTRGGPLNPLVNASTIQESITGRPTCDQFLYLFLSSFFLSKLDVPTCAKYNSRTTCPDPGVESGIKCVESFNN